MALKRVARKKKSSANANVFAGQTDHPTDAQLANVLGDRYQVWQHLITDLGKELAIDTAEWHTSSVKLGWCCASLQNQSDILRELPCGSKCDRKAIFKQ